MFSEWIIRLSEQLSLHKGQKVSTISTYVAGSGDTVERLRRGHTMTERRAVRILSEISNLWPADLVWPADIPRPAPAPKDDAA